MAKIMTKTNSVSVAQTQTTLMNLIMEGHINTDSTVADVLDVIRLIQEQGLEWYLKEIHSKGELG